MLIVALVPVIIARKIANAKMEKFHDKCSLIQIGMTKSEVIYILGNKYSFTHWANQEDCRWEGRFPEAKTTIICSVTFVNGYVADFPIINCISL
jgi:hypothetical protein